MFLIAGLGNPGRKYEHTRHNCGFDALDMLAEKYDIKVTSSEHSAIVGKGLIEGQKVILAKPQTYMNDSGISIRALSDYYDIDIRSRLIVIYDDIALDPGMIRVRKSGSAGGHNGMKSIISHLGSQDFMRIRIGVGESRGQGNLIGHVLGHFSGEDKEAVKEGLNMAVDAAGIILTKGADAAMNMMNKKAVKSSE